MVAPSLSRASSPVQSAYIARCIGLVQVKKAYDLVVDLKKKEMAGAAGNVAQEASGVFPLCV